MKRTRKLVLALTASAMLALGAAAPAFGGPPDPEDNRGIATACGEAIPAQTVLGCPSS